jgi:hypothetical protein
MVQSNNIALSITQIYKGHDNEDKQKNRIHN